MGAPRKKYEKYTIKQREEALVLLADPRNTIPSVSKQLGIPKSTLATWKTQAGIFDNSDTIRNKKTHISDVCADEREKQARAVVDECWNVVLVSVKQLNERIKRLADDTDEIHKVIRLIIEHQSDLGLTMEHLKALIAKLDGLETIKTTELASIMGIALDKFRLLNGEATSRVALSFEEMPE